MSPCPVYVVLGIQGEALYGWASILPSGLISCPIFRGKFLYKRAGLKLVEFRLTLHHRAQQDNIPKS